MVEDIPGCGLHTHTHTHGEIHVECTPVQGDKGIRKLPSTMNLNVDDKTLLLHHMLMFVFCVFRKTKRAQ